MLLSTTRTAAGNFVNVCVRRFSTEALQPPRKPFTAATAQITPGATPPTPAQEAKKRSFKQQLIKHFPAYIITTSIAAVATVWALASNSKKEAVLKLETQERETQNIINKYKRQLIRNEQHIKDLHKKTFEAMIPDMAKRLRVKDAQLKDELETFVAEVTKRREEERRVLRQRAKRAQEEAGGGVDQRVEAAQGTASMNEFWAKFTQPFESSPKKAEPQPVR